MTPREILEQADQYHGVKQYYALVSGGKDSICAAHVADRIHPLAGVLFIDTTIGLDSTRQHVVDLCERHGWPLQIIKGRQSYEEYVLKYGFPKRSGHQMIMLALKWRAMFDWWREQPNNQEIAFISGSRRKESARRMRNAEPITVDKTTNSRRRRGMTFVAPIYEFSTEDTWTYLKAHDLEVSPAYKTLHMSGDCLCGAYSQRGEAELLAIFHPEIADQIRALERLRADRCAGCPRNTWGNQSSMEGATAQETIESFICSGCSGNE